MKYSEAMLKGFEKVEGRQCKDALYEGDSPRRPVSVCVNGAVALGMSGSAWNVPTRWSRKFEEAWGERPLMLNNAGLDWTELYGMARAAGL
jgi:hypothetical protein